MAKFLIQDIIPHEKKHKHSVKKHDVVDVTHHTKSAVRHLSQHLPDTTPESAVPIPEHPMGATDISDEQIPKDPKAMIIEHLYEEYPRNNPPVQSNDISLKEPQDRPINVDAGSWPYNSKAENHPNNDRAVSQHFPSAHESEPRRFGWIPWIIGVFVVAVVIFFGVNYFSGATVLIVQKHDSIPIPETMKIVAFKESAPDALSYSVMRVALSDSREVPATGTKVVTEKAFGRIVVYNAQLVEQRLIKNTRFQGPTGKIYRINDSIIVPKASTLAGGTLRPGSLEVTVYADEAGPEYNTEPVDFTIPGLKDSPRYAKVYARSKGPISGGSSGTTKSVSDQDLKQAVEDIRVSLETKLRLKARGNLTPTQITFEDGIIVELQDPTLSTTPASSEDKAVVIATGTISVVVLDREEITRSIAHALIPTYTGSESISIVNLDEIVIGIEPMTAASLWEGKSLDLSLSGVANVEWQADEQLVKTALLGLRKTDFNIVMTKFHSIERAQATKLPVWKNTFPTDPELITVSVVDSIK